MKCYLQIVMWLVGIFSFNCYAQGGSLPPVKQSVQGVYGVVQEGTPPHKEQLVQNKNTDSQNGVESKEKKEEKQSPPKKESIVVRVGDGELKCEVRLRLPEFFYGKNLRLLNNDNPTDRVIFLRHIVDFITQFRYGPPKCPYDIIYAKMTIRNKGVWGDPESIASTTSAGVNEFDAFFGEHEHGIPLHFLWIRELWIQFSLKDLLHIPFCNQHTLTFGAFPFELGRGIALGVAYALDASDLGFISEYAVDQFAFGGKLSGELVKGTLFYDLYGAILDNKGASFSQTNAKFEGTSTFIGMIKPVALGLLTIS